MILARSTKTSPIVRAQLARISENDWGAWGETVNSVSFLLFRLKNGVGSEWGASGELGRKYSAPQKTVGEREKSGERVSPRISLILGSLLLRSPKPHAPQQKIVILLCHGGCR